KNGLFLAAWMAGSSPAMTNCGSPGGWWHKNAAHVVPAQDFQSGISSTAGFRLKQYTRRTQGSPVRKSRLMAALVPLFQNIGCTRHQLCYLLLERQLVGILDCNEASIIHIHE